MGVAPNDMLLFIRTRMEEPLIIMVFTVFQCSLAWVHRV